MSAPFYESALLDFDGWMGRQDDETRGGIQEILNVTPEPDREARKQRLAAIYAVSEMSQLEPADVQQQWDRVRGGFAEEQGGEWLAAKTDDSKFFGLLRDRVTKQRNERHLLFGLDEEPEKIRPVSFLDQLGGSMNAGANLRAGVVLPPVTPRTKPDPVREAWQNSLTYRAGEAAYAGKSYADALGEWQEVNGEKLKGLPERFGTHEDVAREAHTAVTEALIKARPAGEQAYEQISKFRNSEGGNIAPASLFRGLTPHEKELAFRVMADKAGNGPDKGALQATGEAFGRGFENLAIGGNLGAFQSYLLRKKPFKEGDKVTESDAFSEVRENFRSEFTDDLESQGVGVPVLLREIKRGVGGRKLTAGEAEEWNKQIAQEAEDVETVEQLREFGQQVIDPTNKSGGTFRRKFWLPVMDSAAIMAASAVGGWQGLMLNARSYQGQDYRLLREQGMEAREADKLSEVSGFAKSALDKLQLGILTKGLPAVTRSLQQLALSGRVGTRFAANTAGTFGAEVTIEVMQDHVIPAFVQDTLAADPKFDVAWADVWNEAAWALPDLAMGMVLLSAAGGVGQTYGQSRAARELGSNKAAMRLRGYTMEQIEEISAAPAEARGELLAQYLPGKAPTGEAQTALIEEVKVLAKQEREAFAAKHSAETTATTEAADYAIRVTRTGEGWKVTQADGATVTVDSVEAARRIREDLKQASTVKEAEALVAIVDQWHAKAKEGETKETALTGETVRSDGQTITRVRDGEVVREVTDAKMLETLREEARMDAAATGSQEIDVLVNGQNSIEFGERVAEGARTVVQRLELNQSESAALTAIHEQIEATWRTGVAQGTITREETQRAVASVAAAFDPETARDPEERALRERVQKVARGEGSETEMRETVSELAVAEVLGRRKDGKTMPAGSVTAALDAAIENATDAAEVSALGKFRAFLRAARQYFRAVLGTVAALKKAKREGGGQDFDALVNKLVGIDEQVEHDAALSEEIEEYIPPTEEEMEAGVAFSLGKVGSIGYVDSYGAVHSAPINTEEEIMQLQHANVFGAARVSGADRWRYDRIGGIEWTREPSQESREALANWLARRGVDADGTTFRIGAGKRLELVQKRLDTALAKNPTKRLDLRRKAVARIQRLAFDWETERWSPQGGLVRPIVERRSKEELDKEQAVRQATRADELTTEGMGTLSADALAAYEQGAETLDDRPLIFTMLNDHGKLISRATAARRGRYGEFDGVPWLPPKWYSTTGGLMPDEMAQALFESGMLREPSPDALWDALDREIKSVRAANETFRDASTAVKEIERQARNQAREEAAEWRREQDEMQRKDWSPKARLLRDMRTLDAILSVMPPEIRGKVGGFIKLATLGTDEARAEEIGRRIEKLSVLLEEHLKTETTEALVDLIEKAMPKREPGKPSRGHLGAEAHRYFDAVAATIELTEEQVEEKRGGIAARYAAPTLTNEEALELFEREQILDTFGNWDDKSAADMDAALRAAQEVYTTGRNKRRLIEEARLAEVKEMAEQVVAALGTDNYADIQAQKDAAQGVMTKTGNLALDMKSFGEVLDALLGRGHPLAQKWTRAARSGFAQRNDNIRELRTRWKDALEKATGLKGVKARRALWDMGRDQTIEAENAGKSTGATEYVPIALIDRWKAGTASPDALGIDQNEADMLIADRDAMEAGDQRESLPLARSSREAAGNVKMTEAEGIFLTMLGAQNQYAEALDKAGWTSDALASVETQLSPEAKKLRQFMRNEYRDGYGPLAAIFEQMYGVGLPQIKNYAPASFYHTGMERETGPADSGGVGSGMRAGFLANRKKHRAMPRLENAFATFFGHANQTAHWRGMAEFVREFSGVLGKPEVKMAIEARHGAHMLKTLNDWVRNLEGNGLQQQAGALDKAVSWLTSAQSYIALAYNVGTLAKQSSALLGAAYRMPLNEYARGFGRLMSGQLDVGAMFKHPMIQRRLETGFAPEIRAALNDVWSAKPTLRAEFLQRGMEAIGWTDAFFTTGSAAIAYDYHMREAIKAGMPPEAAETAALREVDDMIGRTAQPADAVDRSLFEARLSPFGRLLFMFASEARQKSSLWLTAWGNTLTGKATSQDLRTLALLHLVVAPMMQAVTAAWRDARSDDDDEWFDAENWDPMDFLKAIVAGPLSGIPLVGNALSGFSDKGIFGRMLDGNNSLLDVLLDGPKDKEAEPVEWYVKRITRIMRGMDAFTGVAGKLIEHTFSVVDNLTPDTENEADAKERAASRKERREAREE